MPRARPLVAILAGGAGTRFWPAGRASRPKQVLALDGDDARPLLAIAWERLAGVGGERCVVAPRELREPLAGALPRRARPTWLLEPRARNTAAALLLTALTVERLRPGATVLAVPADAHVAPTARYRAALKVMLARAARGDAIVTLGIAPTRPATGYGWLEVGERLAGTAALPVHRVDRFVEKPQAARARRFLSGGRHLWNAGTFAFRPGALLAEAERTLPEVVRPLSDAVAKAGTAAFDRALASAYERVPAVSIDHGVMEKAREVEVVRAALDWDDLGSWDAVARRTRADRAGNRLRGDALAIDARDCVADARDGNLTLFGVRDLLVVRAGDAVLVARRGDGEAVRRVVERLRALGREDLLR